MSLLDLPQVRPIRGARVIIGYSNIRCTGERSPYSHPDQPPQWLKLLPATARELARKLKLELRIMQTRLQTQKKLGRAKPTYPDETSRTATWVRI